MCVAALLESGSAAAREGGRMRTDLFAAPVEDIPHLHKGRVPPCPNGAVSVEADDTRELESTHGLGKVACERKGRCEDSVQ